MFEARYSCVSCFTHRMQSVFISLMFPDSGNTRKRQAGREGDVALGLTNDLDTWLWISFSFVTAYKRIFLYSNIHMASMQLERIQKGPTGTFAFLGFYFIMLNHSLTCSLPDAFKKKKNEKDERF